MTESTDRNVLPPVTTRRSPRRSTLLLAATVVVWSGWRLLSTLDSEPHFADESAMIAQSYYYRLLRTGSWNHPDWLHYAAFDHPPLPKYAFGAALELSGQAVPANLDRWMTWSGYRRVGDRWVKSPGGGDFSPPDPRILYWARVPSVLFGTAGILLCFMAGVLIHGRTHGLLAALLLAFNPLYATHARRAMSDSFAECAVLATFVSVLWGWRDIWSPQLHRGRWLLWIACASLSAGMAALAKLNGGVATVIALAMTSSGGVAVLWSGRRRANSSDQPRPHRGNLIAVPFALIAVGVLSFAVFASLNPFLTAQPPRSLLNAQQQNLAEMNVIGRARFLVTFRRGWTVEALANPAFRSDWLPTLYDRAVATLREGYGRYSSLGRRRFERGPRGETIVQYGSPRWAWLFWSVAAGCGLLWSIRNGWRAVREGRPPQSWGLTWYALAGIGVMALIPLNWDRYFLSLQAGAALLVPYSMLASLDWIRHRLVLKPH